MTIQEASERYQIPMHVLREYENWGLCGAVKKVMGDWQYDDTDLERLSTILTLRDIGFTAAEVEVYMRLLLEGASSDARRLRMLEEKRSAALDEIHFRERQLQRLDVLRHEIRNAQRGTGGTPEGTKPPHGRHTGRSRPGWDCPAGGRPSLDASDNETR